MGKSPAFEEPKCPLEWTKMLLKKVMYVHSSAQLEGGSWGVRTPHACAVCTPFELRMQLACSPWKEMHANKCKHINK